MVRVGCLIVRGVVMFRASRDWMARKGEIFEPEAKSMYFGMVELEFALPWFHLRVEVVADKENYYTLKPVTQILNKKGEATNMLFGSIGFEILNKKNPSMKIYAGIFFCEILFCAH